MDNPQATMPTPLQSNVPTKYWILVCASLVAIMFSLIDYFKVISDLRWVIDISVFIIGCLSLAYTTELIVRGLPRRSSFFLFFSYFITTVSILGIGLFTYVLPAVSDAPPTDAEVKMSNFALTAAFIGILFLAVMRTYFHFRNKKTK